MLEQVGPGSSIQDLVAAMVGCTQLGPNYEGEVLRNCVVGS